MKYTAYPDKIKSQPIAEHTSLAHLLIQLDARGIVDFVVFDWGLAEYLE